ncbi:MULTISPECIES: MarR family transcriptional regulator [Chromohalobacter]|nr:MULTISPECIES: MarR family transcriptional regulator [Chromohalobacter]MCI0510330.1 MarR family transcriptional regulator [Chromohalobacter sp.]MCI0592730.1 MarR family transcriptional regulator [Chromohalobacter sp.]
MTEDTDSPLALDSQLCFALYSTQLAMNKLYRHLLQELGLTYPQYLTMLVLWQQEKQTVSAIGEQLHLDSATLTPLLKRLEKAGLIIRKRARHDERQVEVTLTDQGRHLRSQAESIPHSARCASHLTMEEARELKQALHHLRRGLDMG